MIWLDQVSTTQSAGLAESMLTDLKQYDFLNFYTRDTLPTEWHLAHPTRVGDIVVMLKPGWTFSKRLPVTTFPVEKVGSPLGMHGYVADSTPDMLGFCLFWRYEHPLGGTDLGPVHVFQIHPTVAHLLGVKPADGATGKPLPIP